MHRQPTFEKECYLVVALIGDRWNRRLGQPRIVSGRNGKTPSVKSGEVAIKLNIALPASLFEQPQFRAEISVDPDKVTATEVSADVRDNIESILQAETGLQITLVQVEPQIEG